MGTLATILRNSLSLLSLVALAACADGGDEDGPTSEVLLNANHHMFGFRSLAGFGTFPIDDDVVTTDRGTLALFDDGKYTVSRPSGSTATDRYALSRMGEFNIYVTGSNREPSVVFRGAYGRNDSKAHYLFTDRVTSTNSPTIGVYYGMKIQPGQVELEGAWHVVSLHAIFGQTLLSPENVGRGAFGAVSIGAGNPGDSRTISGTGTQGTASLTFGGSIQNLLTGGTGDGTCNLALSYAVGSQSADSRTMYAVANENMVMALDADETDGEAGMAWMVRKFDAPATPVDPVRVTGKFYCGGQTLFVNPSNPGSDTFVGTITLSSGGGFRWEAIGNQGIDFLYTGTYTLSADGGMTITVQQTSETWFGAIDRDYNTFVFCDGFVESRSNNQPELNLGIAVREKTD